MCGMVTFIGVNEVGIYGDSIPNDSESNGKSMEHEMKAGMVRAYMKQDF